jgi:hypothetical protein
MMKIRVLGVNHLSVQMIVMLYYLKSVTRSEDVFFRKKILRQNH